MKRVRWLAVLIIQMVVALAVSYAAYQLIWLSMLLYVLALWALLPALGAVSAYLATVRGLSNYAAWIAPPLMGVLGHFLAFFYPPQSAGPAFLCAVLSVVGAAAGEVVKRQRGK